MQKGERMCKCVFERHTYSFNISVCIYVSPVHTGNYRRPDRPSGYVRMALQSAHNFPSPQKPCSVAQPPHEKGPLRLRAKGRADACSRPPVVLSAPRWVLRSSAPEPAAEAARRGSWPEGGGCVCVLAQKRWSGGVAAARVNCSARN